MGYRIVALLYVTFQTTVDCALNIDHISVKKKRYFIDHSEGFASTMKYRRNTTTLFSKIFYEESDLGFAVPWRMIVRERLNRVG